MENLVDVFNNFSMSYKVNTTDNDNQIIDKSLVSGCDIAFPDLIKTKNTLEIKLTHSNSQIKLSAKSIKNIFKKISNNENLEDNYFDYILCLISNENETQEIESDIGNLTTPLDPLFADLLNKTKTFYISFTRNKNYTKKHITLSNDSLSRIFRFLNSDILQMNDYIDIVILAFDDLEYDSIEKGILTRTKILSKSSHSINFDAEEEFDGKRSLNLEQPLSKKSKKNNVAEINKYFEKVITYIENKNNYHKRAEKIKLNDNNSNLDYFDGRFIPNSHTQEFRNQDIGEDQRKDKEGKCIETCCEEAPCSAICTIF